jgi:hypothetical protein
MTEYELVERLYAMDEKLDEIRHLAFQASDTLSRILLEIVEEQKQKDKTRNEYSRQDGEGPRANQ